MSERQTVEACPAPSVLGAFIEGSLDEDVRASIEQHLADCPECPNVIAEAADFLWRGRHTSENESTRRVPWRWFAAAAAMAALLIPGVIWHTAKGDPLRRLKEIAARLPQRPVEGRLAGFAYAPYLAQRSTGSTPVDLRVQSEAERVEEQAHDDGRWLHARGIAALLQRQPLKSIRLLEAAALSDPGPAVLSDLAAAYLAAGGTRYAMRALAATDRAIALSRDDANAHFNRALALQALGRPAEAADEYARVIELEPRSRWRDEAAWRLAMLRE